MLIRRSTYVHLAPLGGGRVLVVHAISHLRLVVDPEVAALIAWFETPRDMPDELAAWLAGNPGDPEALAGCLAALMERGVLTASDETEEKAETAARLADLHGRDPGEALDRLRRQAKQGADPYWAVSETLSTGDLGRSAKHRCDVLLFGDCELQMEADFLRRAAVARGVDLRVATSFPDDLRLAAERKHDAILVGALRSRRMVALGSPDDHGGDPARTYVIEAEQVIEGLRRHSDAPILLDNLPEPTVQPLGLGEAGPHGHRNRFRRVNLELESLAARHPGVRVVDIAAAINAEGSARLLDDGLLGFTHFGSPGWLLQRPSSELAAVHGIFPEMESLRAQVRGEPYAREIATARAHMDALAVIMALDRKKCVIVDLDGTLWPGVLAETGAPFAWTPEISGLYSYVGLFFGIHEALKVLKRRGVLLACVSKNDEALVRELWRYPDHYPHDRLLTPDDFVTWRVNWSDKAENITSIADELGFALEAFMFVDDHPVERECVKRALPGVAVLGEDLFCLRRALLDDPRLQSLDLTGESAKRTDLVKAQLGRQREQLVSNSRADFLTSLHVVRRFEAPSTKDDLDRVGELFQRTTQFNTTGRRFSAVELARHAEARGVFIARCSDRFGDYGLVAAAVVEAGDIIAFAMSCRVIGLQVEHGFVEYIVDTLRDTQSELTARILETPRNGPVRHLYADTGFSLEGDLWRRPLRPSRRRVG